MIKRVISFNSESFAALANCLQTAAAAVFVAICEPNKARSEQAAFAFAVAFTVALCLRLQRKCSAKVAQFQARKKLCAKIAKRIKSVFCNQQNAKNSTTARRTQNAGKKVSAIQARNSLAVSLLASLSALLS